MKFVQKESVTPAAADKRVFEWAPIVAILPYMAAMAAIPLTPGIVGADLDSGLFFVLAVMSVGVLGSLMAGWASGNKYSLLGGLRVAAQLMSYELPFVLSAASVAVAAGTLSLTGIVGQWNPWWLLWQLPGLVVFFIAGLAELQRPPFDMPVADSEVIFGPYTEYTGLRFAMFLLAEYAGIVVLAGLTTVLFLGGWSGPGPDSIGWIWTMLKMAAVSLLVIWVRVAFPRLRPTNSRSSPGRASCRSRSSSWRSPASASRSSTRSRQRLGRREAGRADRRVEPGQAADHERRREPPATPRPVSPSASPGTTHSRR